ncbi:MAG: methyl-accepting chemotaxis protein [Gammaproteobacteria bacterium]|nr:methyl-accepting chemotaxis protein [Gammaproteobacteria bacterium]
MLVLTITEDELFTARDLYLKQAIGFGLAALFSLGISRTLQRRIDPTLRCLREVERCDLETRIPSPTPDEIGSIQTGINAMIATVATKEPSKYKFPVLRRNVVRLQGAAKGVKPVPM